MISRSSRCRLSKSGYFSRSSTVSSALGFRNIFSSSGSDYDFILKDDVHAMNDYKPVNKGNNIIEKKPAFYKRSSIEFSGDRYEKNMYLFSIIDQLKIKEFESDIVARSEPILKFLLPEFTLLIEETTCILFGLNNLRFPKNKLSLGPQLGDQPQKMYPEMNMESDITTDKLRVAGKTFFDFHTKIGTVFMNEKHLALSSLDLEKTIDAFTNAERVIPLFMKHNNMYNILSTPSSAKVSSALQSDQTFSQKKLLDATSIGSLFTLIGILLLKYKKYEVSDHLINSKLINGPRGLLSIATDDLIQSK